MNREQARDQFAALFGDGPSKPTPAKKQEAGAKAQRTLREQLDVKIRDVVKLLDIAEIRFWIGDDKAKFYRTVILMMNRLSGDRLSVKDAAVHFKMTEDEVREKALQIETQILT